ncbi:ATP-dependent Clp protease ATP-binding subunit ClpX, partial [Durusdinium trenchii]
RRATQSTFLKLMEDTEVTVASPNRMMLGALEKGVKMSTRHVLFVFSGAFSQLDEKLKEEYKKDMKGFGFTNSGSDQLEEVQSMLHKADTDELVKAGMEREFVGRLPVRVALQALSQDDLFQVLTKAEDGATAQLTDDFRRYGIELRFSEPALRAVAAKAAKEGTGARALVTILENTLRRYKYRMPALVPRGCRVLEVEPDLIERPEEELQRLIEQYSEAIQSKQKQHDILHFNQNDS